MVNHLKARQLLYQVPVTLLSMQLKKLSSLVLRLLHVPARTPLRPWLAVAARNRGIDCYNALRRREAVTLDDGLAETLGELAEFDRATTEAADLVGALVAAMTPPDRDIFLRKYYLLQSGKEIAAALGMSVESVNTRLSRGRDRLRRELTAKGVYSHA